MEVVNSLGDGVEHSTGLSLREKLLPEDLVKQLPSLHQLRHQVHIPALIIHLTHEHRKWPVSMVTDDSKIFTQHWQTNITDVFESDDIGMLPVSHQDFDLFRRVPLNFVYYLRNMETQMLRSCCDMASVAEAVLPSAGHLVSHNQHGCSIFSHFIHSSPETFSSPYSRVTNVFNCAFTKQSSNLVAQESLLSKRQRHFFKKRLSHCHILNATT